VIIEKTPIAVRFWRKVEVRGPNECWLWQGATSRGRGTIGGEGGKVRHAAVVAYELQSGPVPPGMDVLHTCDNTLCVNGSHLYAGTHKRNMTDVRVRQRNSIPRSYDHPLAKLTPEQVEDIKLCCVFGESQRSVALRYNISPTVVSGIVRGIRYREGPQGATLEVRGRPLAEFVFPYVPTWNVSINAARAHWSKGHSHTKKWRAEGHELAHTFMQKFSPHQRLIKYRALVVVRAYREHTGTFDVHNIQMKALFDGFTDAGVWVDDSWEYVPVVVFAWAGHASKGEGHITVAVYELGALIVDGTPQLLPAGREEE
jgi:Holliday junction resolvase RusA-like endonuclease